MIINFFQDELPILQADQVGHTNVPLPLKLKITFDISPKSKVNDFYVPKKKKTRRLFTVIS